MSDPFFVQGSIEPGTAFHIVCQNTTTQATSNDVLSGTGTTSFDYWSFLGVKEEYVNFDDVYSKAFYYFDSVTSKYYYPLYLDSTGYTLVDGWTPPTGSPNFYYGTGGNTAATTPPLPDENYVSYEALLHNSYYVLGTSTAGVTKDNFGYYYPLYITSAMSGSSSHNHTFTGIDTTLYMPNSSTNHARPTTPNTGNAQAVFYNPFDSLMNSTFKYEQNSDGNLDIQLVSSGPTTSSADDYNYLTFTGAGNLISFSKTATDQKEVILITDKNVNKSKIYAGVPYKLGVVGSPSIKYNFVKGVTSPTSIADSQANLNKYVGVGNFDPNTNPSITSFIGNVGDPPGPVYIDDSLVEVSQTSTSTMNIYFIPAKESMHNLSTQELLPHMEYTVADMVAMSPSVFNVDPLIKSAPYVTSTSTYYSWQTTGGLVTESRKLAFSSEAHTGMSAIKYSYCTGTDTCGNCFGLCNKDKVLNPSTQCIFDTLSTEHAGLFGSEKEPFTCDHQRYLEKSNYVSNSFIKTHSNTGLVIVLVIGIIIAAGLILYEERNRISKEFFHLKNKS
tara:strand:- start:1662 stop:3335 length:1674 start_codon:yes stop_codon:yes gene_type:complete